MSIGSVARVVGALAEAQARGGVAALDAGLDAARAIVGGDLSGVVHEPALALAVAQALRTRYRASFAVEDLNLALAILAHVETDRVGDPWWPALASELARTLVATSVALKVGQAWPPTDPLGGVRAPLTGHGDPPTEEARRIAASGATRLAGALARGAVAATANGPAERHADAAFALGTALWDANDVSGAIRWLRASAEVTPGAAVRLLLARSLVLAHDLELSAARREEAEKLLIALGQPTETPRDAFEANRVLAMWAASNAWWETAAAAAKRALNQREAIRRTQDGDTAQRSWLSETGRIATLAADALIACGRPEEAIEALDAAMFTETTDRFRVTQRTPTPTFHDIAELAGEHAVVYLVAAAERGWALIVRDGVVRAVPLTALTNKALHKQLGPYAVAYGRFRATASPEAGARFADAVAAICDWMGEAIVDPLLPALGTVPARVTFVTDGVLDMLPLHAARSTAHGWLNDHTAVAIAPSASLLLAVRGAAASSLTPALVVAVPRASGERFLANAAAEAYVVATRRAPSDLRVHPADTTVGAVEPMLTGHGLLHFATHGTTDFSDPQQSGVLLSDHRLTLAQLAGVDLVATRLVVLSACESGMTEVIVPEEKASLATGFLLAGAGAVVASLWAVDDRSTMLLMARFHELLGEETEPVVALREAQRWLRDSPIGNLVAWTRVQADLLRAAHAPLRQIEDIEASLRDLGAAATPFSSPLQWGAFSYFGL